MNKLNIDFLIDTPQEELVKNIDSFFSQIVHEIELYAGVEPIDKIFKVSLVNGELSDFEASSDVFSLGARRFYDNNELNVCIFKDYSQFF